MSCRYLLLLVACCCSALAHAQPQALAVTLDQALAAAAANAEVTLAGHAVAAGVADARAADHAPAPVLSAKAASIDLQNGLGAGGLLTRKRIDKAVGIDWTWERGHKRALRTRAADSAVLALRAELEQTRADQQHAAQDAFWELMAAQERLAETEAIADDATQLAGIAERRERAGDLSAQDALRTRVEADRALAEVRAARLDLDRAALALRQLTRLGDASLALRAQGNWPTPDAPRPDAASSSSWVLLADSRPEVRAAQARVDAAQAALDGALALRKADVTMGASLDHYPGTSNRLLELRVQIPLQVGYAYEGEIGRAQAELSAAHEQLALTRARTQSQLARLALELDAAAERARQYERAILPRARQAEDRAQLAYEKGALPLSDLLDARRTLRATVLEAVLARQEHAKAVGAWQWISAAPAP